MRGLPTGFFTVAVLLTWSVGFYSLLLVFVWHDPVGRAIAAMTLGLFLLWVVCVGGLSVFYRDAIVRFVSRWLVGWRVRFVLFATLLALIEEAIATLMTNTGPMLGDSSGQAHITASANYWEVVAFNSVIVFVPMFAAWAALLSWRTFHPFAVFILFGITGLLAEVLSFGTQNLLGAGFWMLVYGLMVYLPTHSVPTRPVPSARWWHFPLAVVFPLICAMPVALALIWLRPK
jgi:hypothetical protein